VAVIKTAEGAEVLFSEPSPGEILIESIPGSSDVDPLAHLALDALNATEVYEALTGVAAPAALVAAQRRLDTSVEEVDPEEVDGTDDLAAAARGQIVPLPLIGSVQFRNSYCRGMRFCYLNKTGSLFHETVAQRVDGRIYAVQGQVQLNLLGTRGNSWILSSTHSVVQGELYHFELTWNTRRKVRLTVTEAIGDLYHIGYDFY